MTKPKAPTVVRFDTCKCPAQAQGTVFDRVEAQLPQERRDGNGKLIAMTCGRCSLPIYVVCRGCKSETDDIEKHVKLSPFCAREISYVIAHASVNKLGSKKAAPGQAALFSDEAMGVRPKRMRAGAK